MKAIAVALTLAGTQAAALSCIAPDPLEAFDRANASTAPYLLLTGRIMLNQPAPDPITKPGVFAGRIEGVGLSQTGFDVPFAEDVRVAVSCAGPWCGGIPTEDDVLVFLNAEGDVPTIEIGACGGWIFAAPDAALQDRLTACLNDGMCAPAD
ncbi:hypothetical protein SAMN05428995_101162 [Loktanella sp. DSM 29012]|uniref:hypothetical protein n=1 Tax=Loktanella sp. DSM 29012 TaxID=1881056 RepID=UPI0008BA2B3C|nr:hypothetical protein [Loktanella sp. DSM 29012]SEP58094.1 hypothetical protein SAMN05428995_101162 [Loktanella sp. DSM 29012]